MLWLLRYQLRDSSFLSQLCQLIVQHLEWPITTQEIVRLLILVLFLLGIMSNPLFLRWLWNHLS